MLDVDEEEGEALGVKQNVVLSTQEVHELYNWLTNCMRKTLYWEADSSPAGQRHLIPLMKFEASSQFLQKHATRPYLSHLNSVQNSRIFSLRSFRMKASSHLVVRG
jgi:hypothetical protein